ncbi:TetR/AcrR family transcriptional regulator [Haliea sp. E17]|uniref:TetR/AcrR family transcriptional regulator n=1 Tax=Haliea sp. E17 TaxID=3401576 RepID=UPI003AB06579
MKSTQSSAREQRRRGKIQQIVDAAAEVFFEVGFTAASIDSIVEAAGVSKRTIYNYFSSKEEIFIEVIRRQLDHIYQDFEPGHLDQLPLKLQLQHIGRHVLEITNAPETLALFRNMAAESRRFPKLARHYLEESNEKVIEGIMAVLGRANGQSELAIDDMHEAAEHFLDLLVGSDFHRVIFGTRPPMSTRMINKKTDKAIGYFFRVYQRRS